MTLGAVDGIAYRTLSRISLFKPISVGRIDIDTTRVNRNGPGPTRAGVAWDKERIAETGLNNEILDKVR